MIDEFIKEQLVEKSAYKNIESCKHQEKGIPLPVKKLRLKNPRIQRSEQYQCTQKDRSINMIDHLPFAGGRKNTQENKVGG
jgi:hypothetical protein